MDFHGEADETSSALAPSPNLLLSASTLRPPRSLATSMIQATLHGRSTFGLKSPSNAPSPTKPPCSTSSASPSPSKKPCPLADVGPGAALDRLHPMTTQVRRIRRATPARAGSSDPKAPSAAAFDRYEDRPQQLAMADAVERALSLDQTLLLPRPTGTGKTLAYLVPAILSGRKVVVSTATKALEDQIFTPTARSPRSFASIRRPRLLKVSATTSAYVVTTSSERAPVASGNTVTLRPPARRTVRPRTPRPATSPSS